MINYKTSINYPLLFAILLMTALGDMPNAVAEQQKDTPEEGHEIEDFNDFSLEDLLEIELQITTGGIIQDIRESPGIITVVTKEDITRSGARDLLDVLAIVPGFGFGTDSFSTIYPGFRGIWAADGKMLVLLDGHNMQELLYLTTMMGNRFPADWIERVEIIRGPGSVTYGGSAELTVINIVTKDAEKLDGIAISGSYGQMLDGMANYDQSFSKTYDRRNLSVSYGQIFHDLDDLKVNLNVFLGQGNRSDQPYTDFYDDRYNMAGNADTNPLMASLAVDYQGFKLRYLFENFQTTSRDGYGENFGEALPVNFLTSSMILSYDWRLSDKLTLTPKIKHVWQKPWITDDQRARDYEDVYWDPSVQRLVGGLLLSWQQLYLLDLLLGVEYTFDYAEDNEYGFLDPDNPAETLNEISYHNLATYLQLVYKTEYVDISAGSRYEQNSQFGNSFVPRLGLTKTFGPFHFKALYSQAFHVPSIENLANTPDVVPERTTVYEIELGYKIFDWLFASINGFDITIDKPIIYFYDDDTATEGYRNYDQTGTRGFEVELRYRNKRHNATLGYSFYDVVGKNKVETFRVPGRKHVLLGFAPHKITFNGAVELIEDLSIGATAVFYSDQRFGYYTIDEDEVEVLKEFDPELHLNLFIRYNNVFTEGLYFGLGAYNLLNTQKLYIQPYNNQHAPIPGKSIEVLLNIGYHLSFDEY
jgi:outer membrane receptor protein involved in Fe transport